MTHDQLTDQIEAELAFMNDTAREIEAVLQETAPL